MRNLTYSVAYYSKITAVSGFWKTQDFFRETSFFSQDEATFSTFWEILLNQLPPTTNFTSLADFEQLFFFRKTQIFLLNEKHKFLTFWEILLNQLHSTSNLLPLAIPKILKILFEKPFYFFKKKPSFERFEISY